jgi:acyl-lipid omega-6 desaturase (Delta-12 desaturase)
LTAHELPAPGRQALIRALAQFSVPDTRVGLRLFLVDFAVYCVGLWLALFADDTALRVLGAVLVGLKMGGLYTLAHDAAHNSLTASRPLNRVLGIVGYLASLHNYRIRLYDHLVIGHHPKLNGPQPDVYRPMSWPEYRSAPAWRKAWERFVRAPHVFAFAPYGIVSRWLSAEVLPNKAMSAAHRAQAWGYAALLVAYLAGIVGWLAHRNTGDPLSLLLDLLLVLGLPFFMFQTTQAAVLFFQHTHPQIPWFGPGDTQMSAYGPEALTAHVRLPKWFSSLIHDICEHPAHHIAPTIPCYRLREAQALLNDMLGSRAIIVPFSPKAMAAIMRRCKVYDYEQHLWLDFQGRPSSEPIVSAFPADAQLAEAT